MKKTTTPSRSITLLLLSILLCLFLLHPAPVAAGDVGRVEAALWDTAEYVYRVVSDPVVGEVGGEWAVLGLARSGYGVPSEYYAVYQRNVARLLAERQGVLDERKYTVYSRVILALTAAGYDPQEVGGYDLTAPLGDFERTVWQGVNGPIFALIALDSKGYDLSQGADVGGQAIRDRYIAEILSRQIVGGGFAADKTATVPDVSLTGMALQALAKYQDQPEVKEATTQALARLASGFGRDGFWGDDSIESIAQVLVALTELGIDPGELRPATGEHSLLDLLLQRHVPGQGFERVPGEGVNQMATEQALYALAAVYRWEKGLSSLYRMTDVGDLPPLETGSQIGLPGKHQAVLSKPVTQPGKTFPDISGHKNQVAIEALTAREIITGKSEISFDPDATVTRAEFAAIICRGLGLEEIFTPCFADVTPQDWYFGYVGTASHFNIVKGTSATTFNPSGKITRAEAAVMAARAADLCGMNTVLNETGERDILAQFGDYTMVPHWARQGLAFCYRENILSQEVLHIIPEEAVQRGEVAEMLYRMLDRARLL